MRVVVISDTHGENKDTIDTILDMDKADYLIHLGDHASDGEKISKILGIPAYIVRGNCDYDSDHNDYDLVEIAGKRLFLTHGHLFNVRMSLDKLYYKALEMQADIALFGHTHVAMELVHDGLIIMNPGSPSLPRGEGNIKTLGLIQIDQEISTRIISIL